MQLPKQNILSDQILNQLGSNPQSGKNMSQSQAQISNQSNGVTNSLQDTPPSGSQLIPSHHLTNMVNQSAETFLNINPETGVASANTTTGKIDYFGKPQLTSGLENTPGQLQPLRIPLSTSKERSITHSTDTQDHLSSSSTTQNQAPNHSPFAITTSQGRYLMPPSSRTDLGIGGTQQLSLPSSQTHTNLGQQSGDGTISQMEVGNSLLSQEEATTNNPLGLRTVTSLPQVQHFPTTTNQSELTIPRELAPKEWMDVSQQEERENRPNLLQRAANLLRRESSPLLQSLKPVRQAFSVEQPQQESTFPPPRQSVVIEEVETVPKEPAPRAPIPLAPPKELKAIEPPSVPSRAQMSHNYSHLTVAPAFRGRLQAQTDITRGESEPQGRGSEEQLNSQVAIPTTSQQQQKTQQQIPQPGSVSLEAPAAQQRNLLKLLPPPNQDLAQTSNEATLAEAAQHLNTGRQLAKLTTRLENNEPIGDERSLANTKKLVRGYQTSDNQGANAMNPVPTGDSQSVQGALNEALMIRRRANGNTLTQKVIDTSEEPLIPSPVSEREKKNRVPNPGSELSLTNYIGSDQYYESMLSKANDAKRMKLMRGSTVDRSNNLASWFANGAKSALQEIVKGGLEVAANKARSSYPFFGVKRSIAKRAVDFRPITRNARGTLLKIAGDGPEYVTGKKITGDAAETHGFQDPHVRKIPMDGPEEVPVDSEAAAEQNHGIADINSTGYYTTLMAGIKLRSATNTVSMAGKANSYPEMLNTVLANVTALNLKYGETDVPNICFVPGMAMHLASSNFYKNPEAKDGTTAQVCGGIGPRSLWQCNWTSCPASVNLASGTDLETMQASVAVPGTQTMFASISKNWSSSFFNSDVIQRLITVVGDAYMKGSGYAFQEAGLRHCLDIISKYPIPGDEMSQLVDPMGWTFFDAKPTYWIPPNSCFPFMKRSENVVTDWELKMRIVGYDAFAKQLCEFPDADNPWDANWTTDKWWPYNTNELTAVAVVFVKASELSNPMVCIRRMLNRMQWPYCMKMYKLQMMIWDYTHNDWSKSNYYPDGHAGEGEKKFTYGYQVAHNLYLPGPTVRVLFVVVDFQQNHSLEINFAPIRHNSRLNSAINSPYARNHHDSMFGLEGWLYHQVNGDHIRHEFDTSDVLEMTQWETMFGVSSVMESINMIVRNFTCCWGMPKYVIPPYDKEDGQFMGYVLYSGRGTTPKPWKSQVVKGKNMGAAAEATLNDCGYSVPTGTTNPTDDGWLPGKYEKDFRFKDASFHDHNYVAYHRNVVIDFCVYKGLLYPSIERNQSRVADSIFGYVLSMREQGFMWAGICDAMRQITNQQWNNIYYDFGRWAEDQVGPVQTQCLYNQETFINSSLIGSWNMFTTVERPVWNLKAKTHPKLHELAIKMFLSNEFMKRSICPIARVSHFVLSRYDNQLSYNDALVTFKGFQVQQGVQWNMFRNIGHKRFIDLIQAWRNGENNHNRNLRKISMSYYPGCNTSNTVALIGFDRPQEIVLFPFVFIPPCSGLNFVLAYSALQDYTYSLSGATFASLPMGYQLNNVSMIRASDQYLAFIARSMISAVMGMSADYKFVIAPTSIEGFVTDTIPPLLVDSYLFEPFPDALFTA
nr:TPA_asm: hypothetical protein [Becan tricladivirus 1]